MIVATHASRTKLLFSIKIIIVIFYLLLINITLMPADVQAETNNINRSINTRDHKSPSPEGEGWDEGKYNAKIFGTIDTSNEVTLNYFWSRYCPHCKKAKPFIKNLATNYPWLILNSYDLVDSHDNQQHYVEMAKQLQQAANSVPAFIFCGQMMLVGYDTNETTGRELEEKLLACHQHKNTDQVQENFNIPWLEKIHYQDFSLPVFTVIIAALDAFNPCAFFILFFLLSLMVHHRSRTRMLVIGCTFVLCSGLMYFLFMSAWLNLFLITEELIFITATAGLIAVCFGLLNIKDYFFLDKAFLCLYQIRHAPDCFPEFEH